MPDYRIYNAQISIFSNRLRKICLPNCSETQLYCEYFMLFPPVMYSKLGHMLTNVKTAMINKVLIALICL